MIVYKELLEKVMYLFYMEMGLEELILRIE